jgi:AcrR family transcriptional regulator
MDQTVEKTTGWRGSEELWLDAAYRALIQGGIDAVRLGPLAAGLGLSRTSFYGHFASRDDLLAGLLARWDATTTGAVVARCNAPADSVAESVLNLQDCWVDERLFDPRLDMAVRAWALADDAVRARVDAADAARIAAMTGIMTRFGMDPGQADIRACTMYYTQVGYFAMRMQDRESLAHRVARIPQYVATFCGQSPDAGMLARFHARNGL